MNNSYKFYFKDFNLSYNKYSLRPIIIIEFLLKHRD